MHHIIICNFTITILLHARAEGKQERVLRNHSLINTILGRGLMVKTVARWRIFIFYGSAAQHGLWHPCFMRFLDHTQCATVSRIPLDESDNTQHTNIHAAGGFWTHDHSRWVAIDLSLRPRGHWDWQMEISFH
jgi:hypothetical protein